jgi:hypothetical protein
MTLSVLASCFLTVCAFVLGGYKMYWDLGAKMDKGFEAVNLQLAYMQRTIVYKEDEMRWINQLQRSNPRLNIPDWPATAAMGSIGIPTEQMALIEHWSFLNTNPQPKLFRQ